MANRRGNVEAVTDFIFLGSKITADSDRSHEITRGLFLGRKVMIKLDSILNGPSFASKEQASFNFLAAVTIRSDFGAQENKVCHCFHFFPIYLPWSDGPWSSFSECWVLSQLFHSPLWFSSRGSSVPLCILPQGWCHLHIWGYCYFSWQSWFQLVPHPA